MKQRSFYFSDGQYLQILRSLYFDLIKPEAFVQLMGGERSGKSELCETLALYLKRKGHEVVFIDYPIESPEMLRSVLAQKFDLPSINNISRQLEDSLIAGFEKPKILIFDDAHQLSDITLLEIHRLAEIQVESRRVLNVLLCGELELDSRLLNKKELKSLLLNVSRKYLLEPMSKETLAQFFSSYVTQGQVPGLQLSSDALDLLYRSTKGFPGPAKSLIELIVQDNADNSYDRVIDKLGLETLIKREGLQQSLTRVDLIDVNQFKVLGPIATVFAIAVLGFLFQRVNDGDENTNVVSRSAADPLQSESPFAEPSATSPDVDIAQPTSISVIEPSLDEASEPTLLEDQSAVSGTPGQVAQIQEIPSLLRPASVFSLSDDEYEEPVSDSALALVTAAEIGLTTEQVTASGVETYTGDENSGITVDANPDGSTIENNENIETAEIAGITDSIEEANQNSLTATQSPDLSSSDVAGESVGVSPEAALSQSANVDTEKAGDESGLATVTASPASGSGDQAGNVDSDFANIVSTISPTFPTPVKQVSDDTFLIEQEADIDILEPDATALASVRERVERWVSAWEAQQLEEYFSSYSVDFEPRYESSVPRWQASRRRVIGNAEWIRLRLSEYEVIEELPNSVEVHFWLDYESPTYSDSTKKKLVLSNSSGDWMILEEINLQVRS